jgi:hypothetical protein
MPAAAKKSLSISLSASAWISDSVRARPSSAAPAGLPSDDMCKGTFSNTDGFETFVPGVWYDRLNSIE